MLAAVADRDAAVVYAPTVRPFDTATLRAVRGSPEAIVVEPYLEGTSGAVVHAAAHGRDAAGLARRVAAVVDGSDPGGRAQVAAAVG